MFSNTLSTQLNHCKRTDRVHFYSSLSVSCYWANKQTCWQSGAAGADQPPSATSLSAAHGAGGRQGTHTKLRGHAFDTVRRIFSGSFRSFLTFPSQNSRKPWAGRQDRQPPRAPPGHILGLPDTSQRGPQLPHQDAPRGS